MIVDLLVLVVLLALVKWFYQSRAGVVRTPYGRQRVWLSRRPSLGALAVIVVAMLYLGRNLGELLAVSAVLIALMAAVAALTHFVRGKDRR